MAQNPCLTHCRGKNYVTGAMLLKNSIESVWAVINDAEAAPSYIEDMVLAREIGINRNFLSGLIVWIGQSFNTNCKTN